MYVEIKMMILLRVYLEEKKTEVGGAGEPKEGHHCQASTSPIDLCASFLSPMCTRMKDQTYSDRRSNTGKSQWQYYGVHYLQAKALLPTRRTSQLPRLLVAAICHRKARGQYFTRY